MKLQNILLLIIWILSGICSVAESASEVTSETENEASYLETPLTDGDNQIVIDGVVSFYEAAQNYSDAIAAMSKQRNQACELVELLQYAEIMAEELRLLAIEYAEKAYNAKSRKALCSTFGMATMNMNAEARKCGVYLGIAMKRMSNKAVLDRANSKLDDYDSTFSVIRRGVNRAVCGVKDVCQEKWNEA